MLQPRPYFRRRHHVLCRVVEFLYYECSVACRLQNTETLLQEASHTMIQMLTQVFILRLSYFSCVKVNKLLYSCS